MQQPKYLLIDSKDRVDGLSHSFAIQMRPGLKPIKSVRLLAISVPLTNYIVDTTNQNIYFNDGTDRIGVIPPGVYDSYSILAVIASAMESSGYTGTITVTYSQTTFNYTITGTVAFSLTFGTNTINSAAYILGFSNVDTTSSTSHTGDMVQSLSIPPYFYINIDCFPKTVATSKSELATFVVFTNTTSGFNNFFWDKSQYTMIIPGPPAANAVQYFNVELQTRGCEPLDLHGTDWCMLLELEYS